jgi:hypothetical protein
MLISLYTGVKAALGGKDVLKKYVCKKKNSNVRMLTVHANMKEVV